MISVQKPRIDRLLHKRELPRNYPPDLGGKTATATCSSIGPFRAHFTRNEFLTQIRRDPAKLQLLDGYFSAVAAASSFATTDATLGSTIIMLKLPRLPTCS
jgi:hypothetical protein